MCPLLFTVPATQDLPDTRFRFLPLAGSLLLIVVGAEEVVGRMPSSAYVPPARWPGVTWGIKIYDLARAAGFMWFYGAHAGARAPKGTDRRGTSPTNQ